MEMNKKNGKKKIVGVKAHQVFLHMRGQGMTYGVETRPANEIVEGTTEYTRRRGTSNNKNVGKLLNDPKLGY